MSMEMSSSERMKAVMMGEKPDRVPVVPVVLGYAAKIIGKSLGDFYADGNVSFDAQFASMRLHGYEQTPMFGYASMGALEFGGEIGMPFSETYGAPYVIRHPVEDIDTIYSLEVPEFKEGHLPGAYEEADKLIQNCVKRGMPATFQAGSPFSTAAVVANTSKLCKWTAKEPKAVHVLLGKVTDMYIRAIEYFSEKYGPEHCLPFMGGPLESNTVLSPEAFAEFAHPYNLLIHRKIRKMGIPAVLMHPCADHNKNIPYYINMRKELGWEGKYIWLFGPETPVKTQIEAFGDHDVICGNVDPPSFQFKSYDDIVELCRRNIEEGKKAPSGYIMSAGCEMPPHAPPANVMAMMEAAEMFGKY